MHYAADLPAVREAAQRIAGLAHHTPIQTCATLNHLAGRQLVFKCEQWQKVGAFKFRGACNAVFLLSDEEAARGVVTHSSGNHAQALALAARLRGIPAHIVMPRNAPHVKRRAVEGYGARIIECEPTDAARVATAAQVVAETGGVLVHSNNDPAVIAGQGTVALELLAQAPRLDAVIAPIGGGGLLAGICVAARGLNPAMRILGAEPLGADDAARSLAAGELLPQTAPNTIADGLRTSLGDLNWPILRDHVERIITVREDEIVQAMRLMWERAKLLIEPSAAVAVAAMLSDEGRAIAGLDRVGVVLSGGNVDLDRLPWLWAQTGTKKPHGLRMSRAVYWLMSLVYGWKPQSPSTGQGAFSRQERV
ncbi:MAG: pyridoxal-phosphate dependent enzyme [Chloroflexi bacterium]|nr:pyridoxal-phosphate dependent enzyme [Chloroflexota bacterium]MBU1748071.1 pyridoxal-phosphate dependent enzyme [Chloroflexota bacterium]